MIDDGDPDVWVVVDARPGGWSWNCLVDRRWGLCFWVVLLNEVRVSDVELLKVEIYSGDDIDGAFRLVFSLPFCSLNGLLDVV